MAALPDAERANVWAEAMRDISDLRQPISLSKAELRAAIDGLDNFFEANSTQINNAIPQPARGALTAKQKAYLAMKVIGRRWEVS